MARRLSIVMMAFFFIVVQINWSAAEDVPDPQALIGKYVGQIKSRSPSIDLFLEIFAVQPEIKKVLFRQSCPDCTFSKSAYAETKLLDKKGKVMFEFPPNEGFHGAELTLKGNKIVGSGEMTMPGRSIPFDLEFILEKEKEGNEIVSPRELINRWSYEQGKVFWEIIITSIDDQKKNFTGKYITGTGTNKLEFEITEANIIQENGKLKIKFKVKDIIYHLTYYPKFSKMPPALWGRVEGKLIEGDDRNVYFPLFEKK